MKIEISPEFVREVKALIKWLTYLLTVLAFS
jgi:hypothetical protein